MLRSRCSWPLASLLAGAVLLAGCGNSRTPVPSLSEPAAPAGLRPLRFPASGLALKVPVNWSVAPGHGRLVATVSSGAAIVALWRFPTRAAPPSDSAALRQAGQRLVSAARLRDPDLDLLGVTVTRISGHPAVELAALEQIGGHQQQVSSSHLFAPGAEVVLEEYAPPAIFTSIARSVFTPLRSSLTVTSRTAT